MLRIALIAAALAALAISLGGCDDPLEAGTFPCGDFGGACRTGVELCVEGADKCSTCVAISTPCSAADGCACLDDVDTAEVDGLCADAPVCVPQGEGLTLTCARDGWSCG